MLKAFFHPKSLIFRMIVTGTLALWMVVNLKVLQMHSVVFKVSHVILSALGVFIYVFAIIPWYGREYKGLGIEEHYVKILVPTTYLLLFHNALVFSGWPSATLCIALSCLFLGLLTTNSILLFYHLKDGDKTPPAYFAANLYLKNQAKNIAATLVIVFLIWPGTAHSQWHSQNTWQFEGFLVARPNDRWRIDNHKGTGTMQIKYLRHGEDIVISVQKKPGARKTVTPTNRHQKILLKKFKEGLFQEFEQTGFRIVDVDYQGQKIIARAVDKDRRYLLLACVFSKQDYRSNYLLFSLVLDNDDYLEHHKNFTYVVNHTLPPDGQR